MNFYKILMPGFHSRLWLPTAFCEKIGDEEISSEEATLTTELGTWKIHVGRDSQGKLYFQGGNAWDSFIRQHDLTFGDFLLFNHSCNMLFTVFIFDLNSTQKDFSSKLPPNDEEKLTTFEWEICLNNMRPFRCIPLKIWRAFSMHNKETVIVRRGQLGEEHRVKIYYYNSKQEYLAMTEGWPEFCLSNGIKVGDRCKFEVMDTIHGEEENDVLIQVTVIAEKESVE